MQRSATRLVAAVLVLGTAVPGVACGIGVDDDPRALPVTTTTTTTVVDPSGDRLAILYEVQTDLLVPITRPLERNTAQVLMESLLVPPERAEGDTLRSAIPAGTELLGIETSGSTVSVDLSAAFEDVLGQQRQLAIGQIVMTLTGITSVEEVVLEIEGEPLQDPAGGDVGAVDGCEYAELLADPDAGTAELSNAQGALLRTVRERLASCIPS